MTIQLDGGAR